MVDLLAKFYFYIVKKILLKFPKKYKLRHPNLNKKKILQIFLLCLLLFALCDIKWDKKNTIRRVVFFLDVSDSVNIIHKACQSDLKEFYQAKIFKMVSSFQRDDLFAILFFAEGVQKALSWKRKEEIWVLPFWDISGRKSQFDQALEACNAFLENTEFEAILFTDGQLSRKVLERSIPLLEKSAQSIQIYSSLPENFFPDACLEGLFLPPVVHQNTYSGGYVSFQSSHPGVFQIIIETLGEKVYENFIKLDKKGSSRFYFSIPIKEKGWQSIQATLLCLSFKDSYPKNNFLEQKVQTLGEPLVCIVGKKFPLPYKTWEVSPEEMAKTEDWKKASILIIERGSALQLKNVMEEIKQYVFSGGSLFVLGHESTLGMGGYTRTPLEECLPVLCTSKQRDCLSLMILLDVSGSMAEKIEGKPKIQEAKEALSQIIPLLSPCDFFSLLAFRDKPQTIFPFQTISSLKNTFWSSLKKLDAKGGTNIAQALRAGLENFIFLKNHKGHIVLISDGMDAGSKTELFDIIKELQQKKIGLSIIATEKQDTSLLKNLAKIGKGRFYAYPQKSLSDSLFQELSSLQKEFIQKGNFVLQALSSPCFTFPLHYAQNSILQKLAKIKPKDWGNVLLESQEKDPILVLGYYGLGKSAVFSSNFSAEWTKSMAKNVQENLIKDVLSWLMPYIEPNIDWEWDFQQEALSLHIKIERPQKARTIQTSWDSHFFDLIPQFPFEYKVSLPLPPSGKHVLTLQEKKEKKILQKYPLFVPYEEEYRRLGPKSFSLIFSPKEKKQDSINLVPWILALALIVFLCERIEFTIYIRAYRKK